MGTLEPYLAQYGYLGVRRQAGALALALGLLIGGCASAPPAGSREKLRTYADLRLGMSLDEVRQIWGEPEAIPRAQRRQGGDVVDMEYLVSQGGAWRAIRDRVRLTFEGGQLTSWDRVRSGY